ncbi:hypothetical protein [Muricauda sp. MAR_2010_75]|uniref:hypothetical protein n=1 Tax=Allomuricauda sp. MAR_2010_75 TaxID=1250232 RepID=UPI001E37B0FD|nr:hypothetical protein [Muricauda sp. MAR_2010_75]
MKQLEFVGRYSDFNAPEGAEWEEEVNAVRFWFELLAELAFRGQIQLSNHQDGRWS